MSKPRGNGSRADWPVNLIVCVTFFLVIGASFGPQLVRAAGSRVGPEYGEVLSSGQEVVTRDPATVALLGLFVLSLALYAMAVSRIVFVWVENGRIRVSRAVEDDFQNDTSRHRSMRQTAGLLVCVAAILSLFGLVKGFLSGVDLLSLTQIVTLIWGIVILALGPLHHSQSRGSGSVGTSRPPEERAVAKTSRQASQGPTYATARPLEPGSMFQLVDVAQTKKRIADLADTRATYEELKDTGKLPSRPTTVLQIFQLGRDPNWSVDDLVEIVKWDPAVTARVLEWANSVWSNPTEPITSLKPAIMRLGKNEVLQVALSLFKRSNATGRCAGFDFARFWSESVHRAAIAEKMEREEFEADEAFTAGLLCQIGRLSFASVEPDRYADVLKRVDDAGGQLLEEERSVFRIDHNELAAHMMRDWGMPEFFWQAIHYQDERSPERALATTLAVAGHMWRWVYGGSAVGDIPRLVSAIELAKELDVDRHSFEEQYDGMAAYCEKVGPLFDVRTPPFPPWPRDLP